jgi:hypothetical protein
MLPGHRPYILIANNRQLQLLPCTSFSAGDSVVIGLALNSFYGGPADWALFMANLVNFRIFR